MEKDAIRVGEGTISAGQHFQCCNILQQLSKYNSISKQISV